MVNSVKRLRALIIRTLHLCRWVFVPLALIHYALVWMRNQLYDRNLRACRKLPCPVIAVGNIQMGGTAKTPMVLELLRHFQSRALECGVLTRGYRRRSKQPLVLAAGSAESAACDWRLIGDEPAMIFEHLRKGVLAVGSDRFAAGTTALRQINPHLFIMDDGFQHRALHRDLDICMIDLLRWKSHPLLFPFSALRDVKQSLRRADVIVISGVPASKQTLRKQLSEISRFTAAPVFFARLILTGVERLQDAVPIPIDRLRSQNLAAACGIANPAGFFAFLENHGLKLLVRRDFGDHHPFAKRDLVNLLEDGRRKAVDSWIITEKDAVKIRPVISSAVLPADRFLVACVSLEIERREEFFALIEAKLAL